MDRKLVDRRQVSATEEMEIGKSAWLVAPGVWRVKDIFVNVYLVQDESATGWVLIDAGLKTTASKLQPLIAELFGKSVMPKAILLTHAHFDHRGSLIDLAEEWNVPVYCHRQEKPYLTGKASYPPADPSVGGGAMSLLSFTYPGTGIDSGLDIQALPEDGSVPSLEGWTWIHTPGHTPGHVSFFREKDGVLIAGDAVVTTMQESLLAVASQTKFLCGPPKYFTPDWAAAARSVRALAALEPNVIAAGHGQAMYGDAVRKDLHKLAREFWKQGIPATGRYVKEAATFDEEGVATHVPRGKGVMLKRIAVAAGLFAIGYIISKQRHKANGIVQKKLVDKLSGALKLSALGALGATAPASPAVPNVPVIPAL